MIGATRVEKIAFSPNKENEKIVKDYILSSKRSLDVACYSLTNEEIGKAIKLVRRKTTTRILCDKQQAQIDKALCKEVGGKVDKKSGLMHNKFIIRDNECVLTGSLNFTANAVYNNRENFIIICDKEVAQKYTDEFNKLWKDNT